MVLMENAMVLVHRFMVAMRKKWKRNDKTEKEKLHPHET